MGKRRLGCVEASIQKCVYISSDGSGGAIIAWNDNPYFAFDVCMPSVLTQKGLAKWSNNGVAVSTAFDTQCFPVTINDGTGGAIIVWQDSRDKDKSWDVYAQKINGQGFRRLVKYIVNDTELFTTPPCGFCNLNL